MGCIMAAKELNVRLAPPGCLMALPRAFSLQDASLLSGIEPLPLSSPTSPRHSVTDLSSPPLLPSPPSLRRAISSKVTTQLYASLRHSQEMDDEEEEASRRIEPAQGCATAPELEDLADELSRKLREGVEASGRKEPSPYISQMESLRCHLKNMFILGSTVTSHGDAPGKRLEQQSDSTSALLSAHLGQDLSPPLSLAGLEGLFPRYSTLYNAPLPDLQLRETLEKETARRKHLERHIQNLQNEMLELQQRVSVMLAADRRKDSMIQQLDQTLALVVGGWKQQEHQREESMRRLRQEKEEVEQARARDQETVTQVEQQMAEALASLNREKNATKEQQMELQRMVDEQAAQVSQLQAEREAEEEARERERRDVVALQHRMQEQQMSWEEREQELQEECRQVQDRGMKELEKEKVLSQQESQKSQQLQLALTALQGDVLRLEHELQTLHRERDTLQMELNLEKARNESEKVRLESEHKMRLEEVITERLSALHEESARHLCTVREQHRKQLLDLTSQHEAELCNQMSQFKSELQERERRHRDTAMDYELKLSRAEERCQELSRSLRRLEAERAGMLSQLQEVMKSHWSQALRVLTATVPSESSSVAESQQQAETSEQWTSQPKREGVYGQEISDHPRQGIVGVDNLTGIASRHLKESTGSHKETDGRIQRSGLHTIASGSQRLEDSQGNRQVDGRHLADSTGSDLINFSQTMDNRSQSNIGSSPVKEQSLRFMGDGAYISAKTDMGNITGGQAHDTQLGGSFGQLSKGPGVADTTRLYNSATFKASDLRTLQEVIASDAIRKYIASQYIREPYGQLMVDKSQSLFCPEMTNVNIIGTDQWRNTSGNSVTRNETIMPRDSSDHHLDGIHQALMGSGQQMHLSEKTILGHTGNAQVKSSGAYACTSGHKQPPNLRIGTNVHIHNEDTSSTTVGGNGHLMESSNPATYSSLDQAPITIPNLSPISKVFFQGHSREFRVPSAYGERLMGGHQPSHRIPAPEESFYPMQVEELSHSFSSHQGFFPLEPHPDGTMTGTEHPHNEEHSISTMEMPSDWRGGDEATPNPLLQYYIRMLLDRTPGDPLNDLDKGLSHVDPGKTQLSQSLQRRGEQPLPSTHVYRPDEKEQEVSKLPMNPTKNPARGQEVVKKEVLSNQRRPGPPKPLKRVSVRGGRTGVWK